MLFSGLSLFAGLAIAWGLVTAVLILLLIYRGMVGMHQEDQVFLTSSARGFEAESAEATARIARLRPYIWFTGIASAVLGLAALTVAIVESLQRF